MSMPSRLRGLYAVTDATLPFAALETAVDAALSGGARLVQYRDKSTDRARRQREARALLALCRAHGALFVVNDDVALAARVGADGVHVGRDDAGVAAARLALGSTSIVGASCYASLDAAWDAVAAGANYVAFGSLFPSPTKPGAPRASLDLIRRARGELRVPICAIGGITHANAREAIDAGADMVAVISDVFGADDPRTAASRIAALFD
jgi:thiamine-phosphate pyrophosphorylase